MCRLLRQLGVRLNRPKPTVNCPWPSARRTRRLRAIQRLIDNLPAGEVVLYLDEVDIHLNPKIGPEWTPAGKRKYVRTPGCNEKRYLAGALNPKTGKLTWVEGERTAFCPGAPLQTRHRDVPDAVASILFSTTTASTSASKFNWH